jgi:curved DNA-binding protein CbpA
MRRDYYGVLGIAVTAGPREIRQAYRRLARQ